MQYTPTILVVFFDDDQTLRAKYEGLREIQQGMSRLNKLCVHQKDIQFIVGYLLSQLFDEVCLFCSMDHQIKICGCLKHVHLLQ